MKLGRRERIFPAFAALIFGFGFWLRFSQFGNQSIFGDERHSLRAAIQLDFTTIATHFGVHDHCIPLTLWNRALFALFGVSEWILRLPPFVFGVASLVVFPWIVWEIFGARLALILAWLLATSPLHVVFSRLARPYIISLFFSFVGLYACHRMFASKQRFWLRVYSACAVLAPYFHLSFLASAIAPLFSRKPDQKSAKLMLRAGLFISVSLALLLLPPFLIDTVSITGKMHGLRPGWETFAKFAYLLLGLRYGNPVLLVFLGLVLVGAFDGFRRFRSFCGLLLITCIAQLLFTLIANPGEMETPFVFTRFNLILLPAFLVFLALGIERVGRPWKGLPVVFCALLFGVQAWELAPAFAWPNNWISTSIVMTITASEPPAGMLWATDRVPEFYRQLAARPPGSTWIVEVEKYPAFQQAVHRQHVLMGYMPVEGTLDRKWQLPADPRLGSLRTFVPILDETELRRRGVEFVVFHLGDAEVNGPVSSWIASYTERYHQPFYQDPQLVVFAISGPKPSTSQ